MQNFNNKLAYMQFRMRYFEDKKVTELTDEELKEFMELRREFTEVIKPKVINVWNNIKQALLKGGE